MSKREEGFTFVEVIVAMFLLALIALSVASLFVFALRNCSAAGDMTEVGVAAAQRMEILRGTDFAALTAGGSLSSNVTGYFDTSRPDCIVRWTISDNTSPPTRKTISVMAVGVRAIAGRAKTVTLSELRAP
jgi:prepilin-type N-terminal cleavage/methylation domain-containing protein